MNRFQQELARQLPKYNCTIQYDNKTGWLKVMSDGCALCNIHPNRDVTYRSENHPTPEQQFKDENDSIICRDLLGLTDNSNSQIPEIRTTEYYQKRPCVELVGHAAEIIETFINSKKLEN